MNNFSASISSEINYNLTHSEGPGVDAVYRSQGMGPATTVRIGLSPMDESKVAFPGGNASTHVAIPTQRRRKFKCTAAQGDPSDPQTANGSRVGLDGKLLGPILPTDTFEVSAELIGETGTILLRPMFSGRACHGIWTVEVTL